MSLCAFNNNGGGFLKKSKNKVDTAGVILYNNPCRSPKRLFRVGSIAQLGEHLPYKQRVTGSSPVGPIYAAVAELADAQDLKSCCSDTVPVRFRSAAFIQNT